MSYRNPGFEAMIDHICKPLSGCDDFDLGAEDKWPPEIKQAERQTVEINCILPRHDPHKHAAPYRPSAPNLDLSAFTQPAPRKPIPAILELILAAKNAGSHFADQALGEAATLTGIDYVFERQTGFNSLSYSILVKP